SPPILSRASHSVWTACARPSSLASTRSHDQNAPHISPIQDMGNLNGKCSSGASGQRNRAGPRTTEGIGSCVGKQLTVEWISHVLRLFFSEQPQQHVPILVPRRIKCALGHQLFVKCDVFVMNETLH